MLADWLANGGVAQLVERLLCKQEVVGSIPSASIMAAGSLADAEDVAERLQGIRCETDHRRGMRDGWPGAWYGSMRALGSALDGLLFRIVNQVLVRLWMRRISRVGSIGYVLA